MSIAGPIEGCPEKFVGCLTVDDALRLEGNERAARSWAQEAWLRCGPLPARDGGVPDAR